MVNLKYLTSTHKGFERKILFKKFPEPIPFDERRQISQFYTKDCIVFKKHQWNECLKQWCEQLEKELTIPVPQECKVHRDYIVNKMLEALPK